MTYMTNLFHERLPAHFSFAYPHSLPSLTTTQNFWSRRSLQVRKVQALARTYAQAVAGQPVSMTFDPESKSFSLVYNVLSGINSTTTEIFFHREFHYPNGIDILVSPAEAIARIECSDQIGVVVHNDNLPAGTTITIQIEHKADDSGATVSIL